MIRWLQLWCSDGSRRCDLDIQLLQGSWLHWASSKFRVCLILRMWSVRVLARKKDHVCYVKMDKRLKKYFDMWKKKKMNTNWSLICILQLCQQKNVHGYNQKDCQNKIKPNKNKKKVMEECTVWMMTNTLLESIYSILLSLRGRNWFKVKETSIPYLL